MKQTVQLVVGGLMAAIAMACIAMFACFWLCIPLIGWLASFIAGIFASLIPRAYWPIKTLLLVCWGPVIMAFGYYIIYSMVGPVGVINGAICWVVFIVAYRITPRYSHMHRLGRG